MNPNSFNSLNGAINIKKMTKLVIAGAVSIP